MNKEFLKNLVMAYSPSGNETSAIKVWDEYCEACPTAIHTYTDKIGNSAWSLGDGPIKVLLSAHIDEVQCRVSYIADSGIISMINTGGMCRKSLIGSEVVILGRKGPVIGVVEKKAIHCEKEEEADSICKTDEMKINIGAETKEEVLEAGVHVGACVVYQRRFLPEFGKNQVCACGLDDKSGVFITGEILRELSSKINGVPDGWTSKYTVIFLAATQEETGLRGASVAAKELNPDISIDFDVTFSTDGEIGLEKAAYGDVVLGKGGVIEYGPDKSLRIADLLTDICTEKEIPYQLASSRSGGTNTDEIQLRSKNCETMLVSIPNRSMHTPVEVCDWRDMEAIIKMVTEAITSERL